MCFCVWCFMHQTQLLLKSMLAVLDAHKGAEFTLPTSYFASVATVSNLWRSPGISTLLRKTCAELFSEEISSAAFRKTPGRCLRGRWASIDGVEQTILVGGEHLGPTIAKAMARALAADEKETRRSSSSSRNAVGADEDDEYRSQQKSYRMNAVVCTSSKVWRAMVYISHVAKKPVVNFLYWAQKAKQVQNDAMRAASEQDADYMDATPLSQFVVWKAAAVSSAVRDLLSDVSVPDQSVWAPLWRLFPGTAAA